MDAEKWMKENGHKLPKLGPKIIERPKSKAVKKVLAKKKRHERDRIKRREQEEQLGRDQNRYSRSMMDAINQAMNDDSE